MIQAAVTAAVGKYVSDVSIHIKIQMTPLNPNHSSLKTSTQTKLLEHSPLFYLLSVFSTDPCLIDHAFNDGIDQSLLEALLSRHNIASESVPVVSTID